MRPLIHTTHAYHHTPAEAYRHIFYSVLRSGRVRSEPAFEMRGWAHPGHDFIFSIGGAGRVQIGDRIFSINEGELAWIDNNHQTISWPPRDVTWDWLGIRVDSRLLDQISDVLDVQRSPIFRPAKASAVKGVFSNIFKILRTRPLTIDAKLHAEVSTLVAIAFESRFSGDEGKLGDVRASLRVQRVLNAIQDDLKRHWKIAELAQLMGFSQPHLFRLFKQATGATPMDWLRRERINCAKRRLVETRDRISLIAEEIGYTDPLHFSREFKKVVGASPRGYRMREHLW